MRVFVVKGPNAGKTLDYSTRQAEAAIARGWAKRPAAEESPAVPPAAVDCCVFTIRKIDNGEACGECGEVWGDHLMDHPHGMPETSSIRCDGFVAKSDIAESAAVEPRTETADRPRPAKPRRGGAR